MLDEEKKYFEDAINLEWTTFDNKKCSFATTDHQHLSNCYYHWKYAVNGYLRKRTLDLIRDKNVEIIMFALEKRFGGKILPYSPHVNFSDEIRGLKNAGYLQPDGKIIADGIEIGRVADTLELEDGKIIAFEDPFKTN